MPDEKSVRKRSSYKGQLTMFSNYIKSIEDLTLDPSAVNELQLRISRIEVLYDKYDEVQLLLECNEDDIETQMTERHEFESKYFKVLSLARILLNNYSKKVDNCDSELSSRHSSTHKGRNYVELPTIKLPKFSGSYDNWLEFHDTFSSLIHSNEDMEDINKFHYLRASLEGSAAVVIQSIEFSAANYSMAWGLLCERFENKRLLIQNHVSALFDLDIINKESSASLKHLMDRVNKNLRALESLGEPTKQWDTLIIHIITRKLDSKTYREWEEHKGRLGKNNKITLDIFFTFIQNRADLLETIEMSYSTGLKTSSPHGKNIKVRTMLSVQNGNGNDKNHSDPKRCPKCNGEHKLSLCPEFLALSNETRLKLLPEYKICFNCFTRGHYANHCKRPGCKICHSKHNTLVHLSDYKSRMSSDSTKRVDSNISQPESQMPQASTQIASLSLSARVAADTTVTDGGHVDVLLSTALIKVYDNNNQQHIVRALLDSGSTSCLISETLYKRLGLSATDVNNYVIGINNVTSQISKLCRMSIKSLNDEFSTNISCFVLQSKSLTNYIPSKQLNLSNIKLPSNISLADPHFYTPALVDVLIGADVFWDIIGSQRIRLGDGLPILCDTRLGWLVSGPLRCGHGSTPLSLKCNFTNIASDENVDVYSNIQNQLAKFWQLEEVRCSSQYSSEEKLCEEHFIKNTTRLEDGRFCVRIPLKQSYDVLGESLPRAKQCLFSLERRLKTKPRLCTMYKDFLLEYEQLGHMSKCQNIDLMPNAHYIPHHGVLRESSTTTKLRVVFNASSLTTSGVSFNNIQMVGPVVQDDLLAILLRFRQHKYVLTADVEKMYRQITVHPDDRFLQQIIWRDNPLARLQAYQLNTVTYGTASAPYLATRCIKQLGVECTDPEVATAIIHDFYVDDWLSGGDEIGPTLELRQRVTSVFASAQMVLRKWKSNEISLLKGSEHSQLSAVDLNIGDMEPSKMLGLGWMPQSDQLHFPVNETTKGSSTKRDLLSIISQVFDPLRLLAPCIIVMKVLLQKLWLQKLSWDEQLSPEILKSWAKVIIHLPELNQIRIPRRVICDSYKNLEFHIFTDASESAYGACLYMRSVSNQDNILVRLLMAKSRVAPLKPLTIPRLELCGALVGTRLLEKAKEALRVKVARNFFWTDSTIVLGWLGMLPSKLQPFVRNRVAEILDKTGDCQWRHVPTNENPADYVSRGVDINSMSNLNTWWSGPSFLSKDISHWPATPSVHVDTLPELKDINVTLHGMLSRNKLDENELINFERFSNFQRLNRAVAYMLRFIDFCRNDPRFGPLRNEELQNALNLVIKESQRASFLEYTVLLTNKELPKKSPLLKFSVFLDEHKILRVGGRLQNSDFPYAQRHPIIIKSEHRFTKLLFQYEHKRLLHAGPQLLLATIREKYWPIGGRNLARLCCRQCVLCCRLKGQTIAPIMGNLPAQRIRVGFPFENIGLDYAGPIQSVSRQGRGCKTVKVYIAIAVPRGFTRVSFGIPTETPK